MVDHSDLRRLAEAATATPASYSDYCQAAFAFERAASPARIIALLDEIEQLKQSRDYYMRLLNGNESYRS
jgi:hypothetical protein